MYGVVREMRKLQSHWSAVVIDVQSILISSCSVNPVPSRPERFQLTDGEDLGAIYPSNTLPCRAVDQPIEVHTHYTCKRHSHQGPQSGLTHGKVSPPVTLHPPRVRRRLRICLHNIPTDIPHRNRAYECAPDETLLPAYSLHEPEREDYHAQSLGDAVEARCKKFRARACDSQSLEDAGSI